MPSIEISFCSSMTAKQKLRSLEVRTSHHDISESGNAIRFETLRVERMYFLRITMIDCSDKNAEWIFSSKISQSFELICFCKEFAE